MLRVLEPPAPLEFAMPCGDEEVTIAGGASMENGVQ
jgi:hypothetical protein